jgi:hypothetical protein
VNIRNSKWGYWTNLGVTSLADTGFILFVLVPGYAPTWPGILGPVFWVAGWAFTTLARGHNSIKRHDTNFNRSVIMKDATMASSADSR